MNNNFEQLQLRILINHINGAEIAYFYNRESFDLLNIEKIKYEEIQFIALGSTFKYDGIKYIVKNINFKMEKQLYRMSSNQGINAYSPTDPTDFNCQLGVFVDTE